MLRYVIERLVAMLITLAIIVTIGFMVIRLMPGNMFDGNPDMTAEQRYDAALQAALWRRNITSTNPCPFSTPTFSVTPLQRATGEHL